MTQLLMKFWPVFVYICQISQVALYKDVNLPDAAQSILNAVIKTLEAHNVRTADMGGQHKTYEMGDAVKQAMRAK